MSLRIFVDTEAFLALINRKDSYHAEADATSTELEKQGTIWVTTNLVVAEAYSLILRRAGYSQALGFLDFVRYSGNVVLIYSNLESELHAETFLRKYQDQAFSFVDAVSFAVMQEQKITTAFSFDSHFLIAGFQLTPGSIH